MDSQIVGRKTVSFKTLRAGGRFRWHGSWYELRAGDDMVLRAHFLHPNEPTGHASRTSSAVDPGAEVEVLAPTTMESNPEKYFGDFGPELDIHPIGRILRGA